MTLDINVLIEQAARAIVANIDSRPGAWDALSPQAREYWLGESTTALAVIVPAVTAEIRALHARGVANRCWECHDLLGLERYPCRTVRLLDELDAAAKGERP